MALVGWYGQWRKHGLMEPEMVLHATTEYRAEEDVLPQR
jgi:hypothetical protein